jgi:hypothetical protein
MTEPSPPRLSRETVVKALSSFHTSPSVPLYRQAEALDIIGQFTTWRAEVLQNLTPPAEDHDFWKRYLEAQSHYSQQLLPWQGGSVHARVDAFINDEYQRFIDYIRQHEQVFSTTLAPLLEHPDFPSGNLKQLWFERVWELCFLPGVIIPFCLATTNHWQQMRKEVMKEKQRLNYMRNKAIPQILNIPWCSNEARLAMEGETERAGIFTRLLDEELQRAPIIAWKEQLGIDKKVNGPKQRQYIWSIIFEELTDLLIPYCIKPTKFTPPKIPGLAFKVASQMMNLAQPHR